MDSGLGPCQATRHQSQRQTDHQSDPGLDQIPGQEAPGGPPWWGMLPPGQGQFPPPQQPQEDPGGAEGAGAPAAQTEQKQAIDQVDDGRRAPVMAVRLALHDGLHRPATAEQQHRHRQQQGKQAEDHRTDRKPPGQNHIDVRQVLDQPLDPQPAGGQPLQGCPPGGAGEDRHGGRFAARRGGRGNGGGRRGRQRFKPTDQQQIQGQRHNQGHPITHERAQHQIATGRRSNGGQEQHGGADGCPPGGERQHRHRRQKIGPPQPRGGRNGSQPPPAGIAVPPPPPQHQHQQQQPSDEQPLQPAGRAVAVAAQKRPQGLDGVVADHRDRRQDEGEGSQPGGGRRRKGHGPTARPGDLSTTCDLDPGALKVRCQHSGSHEPGQPGPFP